MVYTVWTCYWMNREIVIFSLLYPQCLSLRLKKILSQMDGEKWCVLLIMLKPCLWVLGEVSDIQIHMWVKLLSRVQLFTTPWTVGHQAPPSMEFSRQQYWRGLPFPSPSDSYRIDINFPFSVTEIIYLECFSGCTKAGKDSQALGDRITT